MSEQREPDPAPANDDAGHRRPSEDATADIEERQDTERAREREDGRPPSDAPAY
jgi:hypothetical protein